MLDGNNAIPVCLNPSKYTIDKFNFEANTVYSICVAVSETQDYSKSKDSQIKTTIYKRNYEGDFDTKTKAAKNFYKQVIDKYGYFAFSMNQFEEIPVRLKGKFFGFVRVCQKWKLAAILSPGGTKWKKCLCLQMDSRNTQKQTDYFFWVGLGLFGGETD
jgi:hypothetical protein